jgi:Na+/phosphate symporter
MIKKFTGLLPALLLLTSVAYAQSEEFNADKMMGDLEEQLALSSEKLNELRPALEQKSRELEKEIGDSVEKGFVELQSLSEKLDAASKDAEKKLEEALNSDEMKALQEYLNNIDEQAIEDIEKKLAEALTELLVLTEEQVVKIKPILQDGFEQLAALLEQLAKEGQKNLEAFAQRYEELNRELKDRLDESLDGDQLEKLEKHREELRNKINVEVFET